MILESIVTTVDASGRINLAPMGPQVSPELTESPIEELRFVLKPFVASQTYRNLVDTGSAVIHVTDDAMLVARSAVDALDDTEISSLVENVAGTTWWPLKDCHRWFAVQVDAVHGDDLRSEIPCRVVREKIQRPFFGFNRAKHAVIEVAIIATRTHLIPPGEIAEQIDRLQSLIDKTGGPAERHAFDFLKKTIHERLDQQSS